MIFPFLFCVFFATFYTASAGSGLGPPHPVTCKALAVRKEWRDLTSANKRDYIRSVKCLMSRKTLNATLPANFNRYDTFVYVHSNVAEHIHGVGQFLPWHRHFGHLYENALHDCGYNGPFPYWDWTRDTSGTALIQDSVLFDPVTGFGGNGVPGTYTQPTDDDGALIPLFDGVMIGCVETGPFARITFHVGPNRRLQDHCLNRKFLEDLRPILSTPNILNILSQTSYDDFWNSMDGLPFKNDTRLHDSGHGFLGGDMGSFYTSPNDPLFYLHHAGLDRLWWKWQNADLPNRLYSVEGKVNPLPPYGEVTLDYRLPFDGFSPDIAIRNVMDLRLEPYCYTYND